MWLHHRILHVTSGCKENLQELLSNEFDYFVINRVRVAENAFVTDPFICAIVCLSHLFFCCKNGFVKTCSNDLIMLNKIVLGIHGEPIIKHFK